MPSYPELIQSIRESLGESLPGRDAQYKMAAIGRPGLHTTMRNDVRTAAVLIQLFETASGWQTVVIRRKKKDGDRHSGQISFPGGKQENDESIEYTALRESYEEVGSPIDDMHLLGKLTTLHIPVSNFIVHPFVAWLPQPPEWRRQESEVESIHTLQLQHIIDPQNRQRKDLRVPEGIVLRDVPYFDIAGQTIWGATAMIMSEFAAVVERVRCEV